MTTELLEAASAALGDLVGQVVFVGGATIGLWITDPAAPAPRPTKDVDVIVEVATRSQYDAFGELLRERGFREDQDSTVICRWLHADSDLVLDAMPTNESILGFASRWQAEAFPHAIDRRLPSGARIAAVSPPFVVATKLEAFAARGRNDFMQSRDFEDIVRLFDGRAELTAEISAAPARLRTYVAVELARHRQHPRFPDGVYGALMPDPASQDRALRVVLPRMALVSPT